MSVQPTDRPATIVPFTPTPKGKADANIIADDSGHAIVAMLKKAAEQANDDCARAMDLAHKLTFQLRGVEDHIRQLEDHTRQLEDEATHFRDRTRQLEDEATHLRDRATRAEAWLLRVQNEIENTFFQSKERDPRQRQRQ